MKPSVIFLTLVLLACAWMWYDKQSGHETSLLEERKKIDRQWQLRFDSLGLELDSARENTIKWMQFATNSERLAQKWEAEARNSRRKTNEEVNNRRSFTPTRVDSLLSRVEK